MKNKIIAKLKEKANQIKIDISALYIVYRKKNVPIIAKLIIIVTVVYALSPIDLIPDFIPILGYLDDLIILPALITFAIKLIPSEMLIECREEAKDLWKNGKPKKWYYGIPVIIIWLIIIALVAKPLICRVRQDAAGISKN
ncbi:MAG: YkvA family protein [Termitinemataceae bacterium]|nr:MAG: YkvA family protein [Termitinemataceae bacterium]